MMEEKETQAKKKKRKSKAWHKCCVCLATSAKFPKRKFFRFPSDLERCKEWVKTLKQPELSSQLLDGLHKKYRVCSIHFNDKAYASSRRKYLSKNAVPINSVVNVAEMSKALRQKLQPAITNDMSLKCSPSKDNDVISYNDVSNGASEFKGESSSSQSEQGELNPESSPVASEHKMAVQKYSEKSITPDLSEKLTETGSSSFVKQEVPMDINPSMAIKIKQEPKEHLEICSASTEEVNHSVQEYPTLSRNETVTREIFLVTNGRLSTSHEGLSATQEKFPVAYKVVPDLMTDGMLPSTHDKFPIFLLTEHHPFPTTLEKFSTVRKTLPMGPFANEIKQGPENTSAILSTNVEEVNYSVPESSALCRSEKLVSTMSSERFSNTCDRLLINEINPQLSAYEIKQEPEDSADICFSKVEGVNHGTLEKFSTVRKRLPMGPFAIEIKQKPDNASDILSTNVEEVNSVPGSSALCRSENLVLTMSYERTSKTCDSFPAKDINPQPSAIVIKQEPEDFSNFCFSKVEEVNHGIQESSGNLPCEGFPRRCDSIPENDISSQPLDIEIKQEPENSPDILLANVREANQCVPESPVLFRTENQVLKLAHESESKSRIGSLFQPPVLIMDELVTEEEL